MKNSKRDYYEVLGVTKQSTPDQIKAAYKKLVLKYHPDRHTKKTEEEKKELSMKFQEVHEAYQVLSDAEKKEKYDKHGHGGLSGFNFEDFDPSVIFENIFDTRGGFKVGGDFFKNFTSTSSRAGRGGPSSSFSTFSSANFGAGDIFSEMMSGVKNPSAQAGKPKPDPVHFQITCTLDEIFTGVTKKIKIKRKTFSGFTEKIYEIPVKRGFKHGTKWTYAKEGDQLPNGEFQDIVITLNVKEDLFKRIGDDLECDYTMDISDYLKNSKKNIKLPGNRAITIKGSDFSKTGQKFRFSGYGMPNSKTGIIGDLLVTLNLENKKLSQRDLNEIQRILC